MTNRRRDLIITAALLATFGISLALGIRYPRPPSHDPQIVELGADFQAPVDIEGARSAVTPALTFQDDTDTGIYRPTTNTLRISTGGVDQVEIDSTAFTITPTLDADINLSDFTDPVTFSDTATFSSTATLSGLLILTEQSVSITGALQPITPTTSYIEATATNSWATTIADGSTAGQLLLLHNAGAWTFTLDESEYNADTGGDVNVGSDDTVLLLWDGAEWSRAATLANN